MGLEIIKHQPCDQPERKSSGTAVVVVAMLLLMTPSIALAQSQATGTHSQDQKKLIITIKLGPDQIGVVKTGERLSTRLSFREPIKEVICGDLYDPASGTGSFVVQRIDSNVFIKPVVSKGFSNMFVKVGDDGERIYNFSLVIVPPEQAYLIVNVVDASQNISVTKNARAKTRSIAPPITSRIVAADLVRNNSDGSANNFPSFRLPGSTEPSETAPPPNARPRVVRMREAIKRSPADYPMSARMVGVSGEVVVEVTIDEKGKVKSTRAISGPPVLIGPALTAARFWRFRQADNDDELAQNVFRISFNFRSNDVLNTGSYLPVIGELTNRRRVP